MEQYGFPGLKTTDIVEMGKKIRVEIGETDPEKAAALYVFDSLFPPDNKELEALKAHLNWFDTDGHTIFILKFLFPEIYFILFFTIPARTQRFGN